MNTSYIAPKLIDSHYFADFPGYGVGIESGAGKTGDAWYRVARLAPFLNGRYFPMSRYFATEAEARAFANQTWTGDLEALRNR